MVRSIDTPWTLALRAALKVRIDAGDSLYGIARSCGLPRSSVYEYYHGNRGLSGDAQEKLATFLGFVLRQPRSKVVSAESTERG